MEEEDMSDENNDEVDPLQEIIKRGEIPSAEAIYAARKRRQAAREKGANNIGPGIRKFKVVTVLKLESFRFRPFRYFFICKTLYLVHNLSNCNEKER